MPRQDELTWKQLKKRVYKRYGRKCYLCRVNPGVTMDHRIPVALGGKTDVENLRPCCRACNAWKKDAHPNIIKIRIRGGEIPPGREAIAT